jgi:hypothetical protein
MNTAFEMLKAAEKAGVANFSICHDYGYEEFENVSTAKEAWEAVNSVEIASVYFINPDNDLEEEWALIIPENGDEEGLSDFYTHSWVTDWVDLQYIAGNLT